MTRATVYALLVIQTVLALRFFARIFKTLGGDVISAAQEPGDPASTTVIIPVLNEADRLEPCLTSVVSQGDAVSEIIVVDGGSTDGTADIVERFAAQDHRVRLVDAAPVSNGWNGKAWGLEVGLRNASTSSQWLVAIDADVRLRSNAVVSAVSFAERSELPALSVATSQRADTLGLSLIHPSLLSTLVYRFGIPGHKAATLDDVQANGQFAVYERQMLVRAGGFKIARSSICEEVTLARHLFLSGYDVGFYEANDLAETVMYRDGVECLQNWPRSLVLRDKFQPDAGRAGLLSMLLLQVVPMISLIWTPRALRPIPLFMLLNRVLVGARIGVMLGTRRAYSRSRWSYVLSPLFDPVSLVVYAVHLKRRQHSWRGQTMVAREV